MLGIGSAEMLLIMVLGLIVLGPTKFPGIAKSLGRGYAEFKRATQELRDNLTEDVGISDFKNSIEDAKNTLKADLDLHGSTDLTSYLEPTIDDIQQLHFNSASEPVKDEPDPESTDDAEGDAEQSGADGLSSSGGDQPSGAGPIEGGGISGPASPETTGEGKEEGIQDNG